MDIREQNLLKVLELLVLLFDARKQVPKLTDEEKHTLTVTKEHLEISDISIPAFTNTLREIAQKKYLIAVSIFEDKKHHELIEALQPDTFSDALAQAEQLPAEAKDSLNEGVRKVVLDYVPKHLGVTEEDVEDLKVELTELLKDTKHAYTDHTPEDVCKIVILPFRSIHRLLNKMKQGSQFDEITDNDIWYDHHQHILFYKNKRFETVYNKESYVHFSLRELFSDQTTDKIYYSEIPEFDINNQAKQLKAYRDSLDNFVKKHPELDDVLDVHTKYLEIDWSM